MNKDALQLSIPVAPEQVATARMFVAAAARQFGMEGDPIEDLKVAISEMCTGAIQAHQAAGIDDPIHIILKSMQDHIEVEVKSSIAEPGGAPDWDPATPTHMFQKVLGVGLIKALFGNAEWITQEGQGTTVRFSLPISAT